MFEWNLKDVTRARSRYCTYEVLLLVSLKMVHCVPTMPITESSGGLASLSAPSGLGVGFSES